MRGIGFIVLIAVLGGIPLPPCGMGMELSQDKAQVVPIRVPAAADERIEESARDLSRYLEKMFGKPFPLQTGGDGGGILLGTLDLYPQMADRLNPELPGASEGYVIQSEGDRIFLIGASPLGVQNAVWDFLYRLGYRHYFPGATWEIVPALEKFDVDFDVATQPVFATRQIGPGYGLLGEAAKTFEDWKKHNRLDYGFRLRTGHTYDAIIKRNREEFLAHPEYLSGPLRKEGRGDKFIIANADLRKLVVEDALEQLAAHPEWSSVSMDPSDGGRWPESSPLGSVSNQVVTLANEVAKTLREEAPGKKVGIYAYNDHSPAPSIAVDPDVIVSVATAFIRGGKPVEVQMREWQAQGAVLGIRDYLGVWTWDHDLPGKSRGSSPARVAEKIRQFSELGARYYITETSQSAGQNGLGHFQASRSLWDPNAVEKVDETREEFLSKAFGPARDAMEKYFDLTDGKNEPLLSDHLIGGMYRALGEAYGQTKDEEILRRLDDLAAYTRFVDLYRSFDSAGKSTRQATFDEMTEFSARISDSGMVSTRAMLRDLPVRNKDVVLQEDLMAAAKTSTSFGPLPTREELMAYVEEGSRKYPALSFEPRAFSLDLVPLEKNPMGADDSEESVLRLRSKNTLFTYLSEARKEFAFEVEGGQLAKNAGPVRISVFPIDHPLGESVFEAEIPADKERHSVRVKSDFDGLHRVEISDGGNLTLVIWPSDQNLAIPSGQEDCAYINARYSLSFFVPEGTRTIGGYVARPTGRVLGPDGVERMAFSEKDGGGYFEIEVPEEDAGKVWRLDRCLDRVLLMNVPPFLSFDRARLLVPREVRPDEDQSPNKPSKHNSDHE